LRRTGSTAGPVFCGGGVRRERYGSRERAGELGEDRQVGVEPDPFQATDAERTQRPLVFLGRPNSRSTAARRQYGAVKRGVSRGMSGCRRSALIQREAGLHSPVGRHGRGQAAVTLSRRFPNTRTGSARGFALEKQPARRRLGAMTPLRSDQLGPRRLAKSPIRAAKSGARSRVGPSWPRPGQMASSASVSAS
jgi:hypothetical protein